LTKSVMASPFSPEMSRRWVIIPPVADFDD
jgi:hypothetical protein